MRNSSNSLLGQLHTVLVRTWYLFVLPAFVYVVVPYIRLIYNGFLPGPLSVLPALSDSSFFVFLSFPFLYFSNFLSCFVFMLSLERSLCVDVPLISSCPADHEQNWQPHIYNWIKLRPDRLMLRTHHAKSHSVADDIPNHTNSECSSWLLFVFSHSAHWLPTRKKLLYTVANPTRGLLNREKKKKKKSGSAPPPPPARCSFGEKIKIKK